MNNIEYYLSGDRLKHSIAVSEKINSILPEVLSLYREKIVTAAIYHDIGYSDFIEKPTNNHNLDGYQYIRHKVDPVIAYLVLMHSNGKKQAYDSGLRSIFDAAESSARFFVNINSDTKTKLLISDMVDLINYCDMTTSRDGADISMDKRLEDIGKRYSKDSLVYNTIKDEIFRLKISFRKE